MGYNLTNCILSAILAILIVIFILISPGIVFEKFVFSIFVGFVIAFSCIILFVKKTSPFNPLNKTDLRTSFASIIWLSLVFCLITPLFLAEGAGLDWTHSFISKFLETMSSIGTYMAAMFAASVILGMEKQQKTMDNTLSEMETQRKISIKPELFPVKTTLYLANLNDEFQIWVDTPKKIDEYISKYGDLVNNNPDFKINRSFLIDYICPHIDVYNFGLGTAKGISSGISSDFKLFLSKTFDDRANYNIINEDNGYKIKFNNGKEIDIPNIKLMLLDNVLTPHSKFFSEPLKVDFCHWRSSLYGAVMEYFNESDSFYDDVELFLSYFYPDGTSDEIKFEITIKFNLKVSDAGNKYAEVNIVPYVINHAHCNNFLKSEKNC
ncbi:hypothetical protein [Methanococcus maripaludis]|uniref:Uncharacterized protein n=2 Tax=Methanococcus maripaludis TaxID=39152 RepID=A0A7J9PJG9_METMI|nr:hypothetical protein [Methanococcus maripaludis]MBA2862916.1 hypothetical protein [Methanococcus maripaludis]